MKRFLLDTNVLSDSLKPRPTPALTAWLSRRRPSEQFISTITLGELRRGIVQLPQGARRAGLQSWYEGPDGPPSRFTRRILAFDEPAANAWAEIMADGSNAGTPRSPVDMMIAAVARAQNCVLVTLNQRHFRGVVDLEEIA